MRPALIVLPLLAVSVATVRPPLIAAQQPYHSIFSPIPDSLSESPELVLGQYLLMRRYITGKVPKLRFCGPEAMKMLTPAFINELTSGKRRMAESVTVSPVCRSRSGFYDWMMPGEQNRGILIVTSMSFGALSSSIEALAFPSISNPEMYFPPKRRESFRWDHSRAVGGQTLTFSDFAPPN